MSRMMMMTVYNGREACAHTHKETLEKFILIISYFHILHRWNRSDNDTTKFLRLLSVQHTYVQICIVRLHLRPHQCIVPKSYNVCVVRTTGCRTCFGEPSGIPHYYDYLHSYTIFFLLQFFSSSSSSCSLFRSAPWHLGNAIQGIMYNAIREMNMNKFPVVACSSFSLRFHFGFFLFGISYYFSSFVQHRNKTRLHAYTSPYNTHIYSRTILTSLHGTELKWWKMVRTVQKRTKWINEWMNVRVVFSRFVRDYLKWNQKCMHRNSRSENDGKRDFSHFSPIGTAISLIYNRLPASNKEDMLPAIRLSSAKGELCGLRVRRWQQRHRSTTHSHTP